MEEVLPSFSVFAELNEEPIKKTVTYAKISPQNCEPQVNPRDIAGERRRRKRRMRSLPKNFLRQ